MESDPYRDVPSWEDAFKRERSAYERLREESNQALSQIRVLQDRLSDSEERKAKLWADNQLLRETCERTLEEMRALKDAIREMEDDHRKEIRELERSVMREMTEAHREGYEEGRREAKQEFDMGDS